MQKFDIDSDITKASTLPASFYRDPEVFEAIKNEIFYKSWQWIGHENLVKLPHQQYPFTLLDGFITEPVVLTKDQGNHIHCLTNVCTHRGNLVVAQNSNAKKMICGYHGRRFQLDGTMEYMPEFKEAQNFPKPCDNLYKFPLRHWGPFLFMGLSPTFDIDPILAIMNERIGFFPFHEFKLDESRTKEYMVSAHWALYCDNYLEGFHIPFVHNDLNEVLDYGNYETLLYDHVNLQIGYAQESEEIFEFPENHIDHGKNIAAYYFWVFPNMMFNFYPWGLSVNIVHPMDLNSTKVTFQSYVYDESKLNKGAGSGLEKVEFEDEEVVESVQKGVRSKFYKAGRFSPTREKGVHHFHRLLASFLNEQK